jgi:hypothetical protein
LKKPISSALTDGSTVWLGDSAAVSDDGASDVSGAVDEVSVDGAIDVDALVLRSNCRYMQTV